MPKIRSNKPLKYSPINPEFESIIELKITEIRDYIDSQLTIVTIEDSLVNSDGSLTQLNIRQKQFTFTEIDQLKELICQNVDTSELSYMEERLILLQEGLLLITKQDPIYFSTVADWEVFI